MTDMDILSEPQPVPRRGLGPGSIMLLIGVALTAIVFGVALFRQNQTQPETGSAPDFTLTTLDDGELRLADQRGKVVVLNFWASWCIPCRDEAPVLQSIWEKYRDRGVVVVGVAYTDTERGARDFIAEYGQTYPNGMDLGTRISEQYHIQGVPETFIIDQQGNVAEFIYAAVNEADLSALLDSLLEDGAT
jgi:cytochrome c biogenesis protein CcmG/thiol:disulfide interchange protein DsbE